MVSQVLVLIGSSNGRQPIHAIKYKFLIQNLQKTIYVVNMSWRNVA